MMILPVPSWRTTRAMADFRRPVPMIVWAANPPGSLDFTCFLIFSLSSSAGEASAATATAVTAREGFLGTRERESVLVLANERVFGFWEMLEEKESVAVRVGRETAMVLLHSLCLSKFKLWLDSGYKRML